MHTGEATHKCAIFGKQFTGRWSLNRHTVASGLFKIHMIIYIGEIPHNVIFVVNNLQQNGCSINMIIIHNREVLHNSIICAKQYTQSGNFNIHMLIYIQKRAFINTIFVANNLQRNGASFNASFTYWREMHTLYLW